MKTIISLSIFLFIFSIVICGQNKPEPLSITPEFQEYSDTGDILERKDSFVQWKDSYFSDAVKSIFWLTNVPSGFSLAFENVDENEIKINNNPKSIIVKELLNEVIKYDSRYQWKEINGVVNIFPKNDYPILDIRIPEFKFETSVPLKLKMDEMTVLNELEKKLIETKEFQTYIKERNLLNKSPGAEKYGFLCCGFIGRRTPRAKKMSVDLKNATIREILNEIVKQRDFGSWSYQEYNVIDEGNLYHMFRLKI